jgi:hypothetical protein
MAARESITTHAELAEAIREAFVACDDMEPSLDKIADEVFHGHTFGGELSYRRARVNQTTVRIAVAMFFEHEYEATGATDDPKRDAAITRCQEFLDALRDLFEVGFTLATLEALRPLDRRRFYRLVLAIYDPDLQTVYDTALRNDEESEEPAEGDAVPTKDDEHG